MTPQWFRFTSPGVQDQYGYGTESEAEQYVRELAPDCSAIPLSATPGARVDGVGFSIREALALSQRRRRHASRRQQWADLN